VSRGYIQIYTGDGKGKSTAAFGLAVRALCAGMRVYIGQFVKSIQYNETRLVEYFPNLKIEQFGLGCLLQRVATVKDREAALEGLEQCRAEMLKGEVDLLVLDEITIAISLHLLTVEEVVELLREKPESVELVLTGRYAPEELLKEADLVTEMKEIKHYYQQGVLSREGLIIKITSKLLNYVIKHTEKVVWFGNSTA